MISGDGPLVSVPTVDGCPPEIELDAAEGPGERHDKINEDKMLGVSQDTGVRLFHLRLLCIESSDPSERLSLREVGHP